MARTQEWIATLAPLAQNRCHVTAAVQNAGYFERLAFRAVHNQLGVASFRLGLQSFEVCVQLVLRDAFPALQFIDPPADFGINRLAIGH